MKKPIFLSFILFILFTLAPLVWANGSVSITVPAGGYAGLADAFGFDSPQWFFLRNGSMNGVICCSNDPFVAPKVDAAGVCNTAEAFFPHQPGQLVTAGLINQAICTSNVNSVLYGEAAQ